MTKKIKKIKLSSRRKKQLILGLLVLVVGFYLFWNSLPAELFKDPLSAALLSRDGHLLGACIAEDQQWRFPSFGKVPEKYCQALIHFEDKRFYQHPGVDPLAMVRAMFLYIKSGKPISGGSTITMQVMRLSGKKRKRTILDKVKEMIQALRLEMKYSKEEILALYAANAPFGGNIVGLEAASWFYFGRSAGELSWAESALLAVLPNSPALIHPGKNRKILMKKRNRLLKKLKEKGVISELEYSLAIQEPLPGDKMALPRLAPHLMNTLMDQYREKGLRLFQTTLDKEIQKHVTAICEQHSEKLKLRDIKNAAAIVIDNRSAEVVAYVGNTGLGMKQDHGQEVDIIRSSRSTGSILKPLLYAAMLESGEIAPTTLIPDIPTQYDGFMPDNYDRQYRGAVPARKALAQSLNIPAVRMLRQYGVHRFYDFLKKCGMTTLHRPADDYGLTLILGGAEAKLYDVACIYSKLAQQADPDKKIVTPIRILSSKFQGKSHQTTPNEKFLQGGAGSPNLLRGDGFLEKSPPGTGAAYLTLEALLEVVRPGLEGYWKNFSSSKKIAWKTGTSYGFRDAWAVGVTPRYTVGVWVGNADGEGKPGLTGISAAAPVLFDIFNFLDNEGDGWFEKSYLSFKPLKLCKKSGCLASELCEAETVLVPVESHFSRVCPYHHRVHLDSQGIYRVDSRCESIRDMRHQVWFTLPPIQEFYYQKHHPGYKMLPPFRCDCKKVMQQEEVGVMSLEYPSRGASIYIPVDLDGTMSQAVFRAVHRSPDTVIYWHIDDRFVGETAVFHQLAVNPGAGEHRLILVDEHGNRLERRFRVLSKTN
ncbi:MAG: penicillin-binding protein 1C [Candidatus Aminicenantes bacterium]|nr:MAG: penicillin-binding protein 1C [Candidatus Aminicenantes bacterium]